MVFLVDPHNGRDGVEKLLGARAPIPGAPVAQPRLLGPSAFTVAFLAFGIRECHGRQPTVFMILFFRYVTALNGNGGCPHTVPSKRPAHEVTRPHHQ